MGDPIVDCAKRLEAPERGRAAVRVEEGCAPFEEAATVVRVAEGARDVDVDIDIDMDSDAGDGQGGLGAAVERAGGVGEGDGMVVDVEAKGKEAVAAVAGATLAGLRA